MMSKKEKRITAIPNDNAVANPVRTHFSLWCMLAADIRLRRNATAIDGDLSDIVTNETMLAISRDKLGKQAKRLRKGAVEIYAKPLENGRTALLFFNRSKSQKDITLRISDLEQDSYVSFETHGGGTTVTDVWANETTALGAALNTSLPAYGVKVYVLEAYKEPEPEPEIVWKGSMDFLVTTDKNYIKYLLVLMSSVYHNHDGIKLTFHILHHELTADEQQEVADFAAEYKQEVSFYQVDNGLFADFPVGKAWPTSCMYILFAHNFLPTSVKRVLYLDIDMAVNGNLEEFYDLDFGDNFLIATKEHCNAQNEPENEFENFDYITDINDDQACQGSYFNSGMLLFNLEKFRQDNIDLAFYLDRMRNKSNIFYDQGILNLCFANKTKFLTTCKYNYRLAFSAVGYHDKNNSYTGKFRYNFIPIDAKIIHYCGWLGKKPWLIKFKEGELRSCKTEYFEFIPEFVQYSNIWWKYAEFVPNYQALLAEANNNKQIYNMVKQITIEQDLNFVNTLGLEPLNVPIWRNRNTIDPNSDLNRIVNPRTFRCVTGAVKATIKNLPEQFTEKCGFRLTVKNIAAYAGNDTAIIQILEPNDGKASIYRRCGNTGGSYWSAWEKLITSADLERINARQAEIINDLAAKIDELSAKIDQSNK